MKEFRNEEMKWCFSSIGCPNKSLEEMLKLAVKFGISALELRYYPDKTTQPDYCKLENAEETIDLFDKYNVKLFMLGGNCSLVGGGTESDEEYLEIAELADKLNVKYIRVFDGLHWGDEINEKTLDEAAETVRRRNKIVLAKGWNVKPAIETHSGFSSGKYVSNLIKKVNIDVVWDIHHTVFYGKETAEETWNYLNNNIVHVHVKDSIPKPSARHPYTLVLPGEGVMPMKDAISFLREKNYNSLISLEWEKQWHPYLPELEAALDAVKTANWKF